jgi:RNA polymerase sigma-70 factor (ECF subfamily)
MIKIKNPEDLFYLAVKSASYSKPQQSILIDLRLIEECRNGNFNNFRKLVELTSPIAYSVAFRMLGDEAMAKDVVQETMVTIWQKLKKIKTAEVYRTWTYRIVVNKCYDQMRKRKRNPEFVADEKSWEIISNRFSEGPSTSFENGETTKIIGMLTERLSTSQKTVFVLSELEGMSNDEISEITGTSKSAVKANLYHARKSISEKIEKYI